MKHTRRLIAFLLVIAMVCTFTGTAFAAGIPVRQDEWKSTETREIGFRSPEFIQSNSFKYADDDIVRAIVLLDGLPEIETALGNLKIASSLRSALKAEHQKVLDLMKSLKFDLAYEFTSLLNGFSLDVAYGDLDFIADLPGVSSVHIANYYTVPETRRAEPLAMVGGEYSGNIDAAAAGYNGAGQVIAILDTGLDLSHEAFQDVGGLCAASAALTAEDITSEVAPGTYISAKVPFAYDYADNDKNVDDVEGHGTHVSGIAAGYAYNAEEGSVIFQGAAPAAQILAMKIFPDKRPGTTTDIYFRALEDAYRLGADVVNMSLGSVHGFTYDDSLETEVFGNIYERLDKAGIVLSCAAGNSGSQADTPSKGYLGVDYNDHGTVSNPSTMEGNLSVASMENARFPLFAVMVNDQPFAYSDGTISAENELGVWLSTFHDQDLPFTAVVGEDGMIGIGTAEEFAAADVKDRVAVVRRGTISFQEKADNAAAAGAIALVVCNNEPGLIRMQIEEGGIPAICVVDKAQDAFLELGTGTFFVPGEKIEAESPDAFKMSVFSSWGPTSSLTIDPCLTSFGGNINSAAAGLDHEYIVMSGTSMATPMMTGTIANVLTFLDQSGFAGTPEEQAHLAEALLQSSATIVPDGDSIFAVRRQGAGLGDATKAIQNYQHAGYVTDPLKELGDDPAKTGVYSFDFTLCNTSSEAVHYADFNSYVLADVIANIGSEEEPVYANQKASQLLFAGKEGDAEVSYAVNGSAVESLDLAAGESAVISVTIKLSDNAKSYLDIFTYGAYVEGFVTFTANEKYENHATFLAYYGDWTEAPILETTDFRDFLDVSYQLTQIPGDEAGHSLAELGVTPMNVLDVYTMPNMAYIYNIKDDLVLNYAGANLLETLPFRPEYVSFATPESSNAFTDGLAITPYQLRNARAMDVIISNAETGEVYVNAHQDYSIRAIFDYESSAWNTATYWIWDGSADDGSKVPSGTVVNVRMDTVLPYGHNGEEGTLQENGWNFDITVDYTAPALEPANIVIDHSAGTMTVTASDPQYLQAIMLMDARTGATLEADIYDAAMFAPEAAGESCTAVFDIQRLLAAGIKKVDVVAMDYATNMTEQVVTLAERNKNASITLNAPVSDPVVEAVKTGKAFTFPACEDAVEGAKFVCWTTASQDCVSAEDFEQLPKFYPGEKIVVTGDAEYYALYAFGQEEPLETTRFALDRVRGSYAGEFAIVGLNAVDGAYDPANPMALSQGAATVSVADQEDVSIDNEIIAFYTDNASYKFVLEANKDGLYTIRNAADNTYLAMNSSKQLECVDSVSRGALWNVAPHAEAPEAVEITNSSNRGRMMLVYNPQSQAIELIDKNTVVGQTADGKDVTAQQAMQVWLYSAANADFIVSSYSTNAESAEHEHQWDEGVVTKEPTCTETGVMTYTCAVCGETRTEEIPALGHDWDEGVVTKEPTCTEPGVRTFTCRRCGETKTEEIPALGHDWDEGVVTKEPTATEEGEITYTCRRCGDKRVEKIPALAPVTGPDYFKDFTDCNQEWYHEAVNYMVHNGLMAGVGDNRFAPSMGLTRSMVVQVLYRVAGSPDVQNESGFADVAADAWYSEAVAWAKANDVVAGVGNNRFAPDMNITREQIATILWSSKIRPVAAYDLSSFSDSDEISDYAKDAMEWAVSEGLFAGDDNGRLNPGKTASRAEFAVIMLRYLDGAYEVDAK